MGEGKAKDNQPTYQEPHEGLTSEELDNGAERPDTSELANKTPHGREETKNDKVGGNQNG